VEASHQLILLGSVLVLLSIFAGLNTNARQQR
jgi:hypothetical protein